jgi:hypothetical protein
MTGICQLVETESSMNVRPDVRARDAGHYIVREHFVATMSRAVRRLAAGQYLRAGTVLGSIAAPVPSVRARDGGNVGDGTLVMNTDAPLLPGAREGTYSLTYFAPAGQCGAFRVEDPNGYLVGHAVPGEPFATSLQFLITAGAAPFSPGDGFEIDVEDALGHVTQLRPRARDGRQIVAGILFYSTDAISAAQQCVITARTAVVSAAELVWPDGITEAEKASAIAQLAALDIAVQ